MYLVKIAWHRPKADCGWLLEQCTGQLRTGGRKLTVAGPGLIHSSAQGPHCCGTQASRLAGRAFAPVLSITYATCTLIPPSVSVTVSRLKWWRSCVLCLSYARLCPDHMDGSQRSTAPQHTRHARSRRPNEDREVLECGLDRAASAAIPPRPCSWLHTVLVAYWSMVAAIAHRHNTPHTPCTPII